MIRPAMIRPVLIGLACLAVLGGAAAFSLTRPDPSMSLPYRDAQAVAQGAQIYEAECAACHGENLQGAENWRQADADGLLPAPPHDESGHTWHHPDAVLFAITKLGSEAIVGGGYRSNMMGFGDILTDAEILAVLAYIKSTWPPRVIERHNQLNAASR